MDYNIHATITAIQNDTTWIESGNKPNGSHDDDFMKGRIKTVY